MGFIEDLYYGNLEPQLYNPEFGAKFVLTPLFDSSEVLSFERFMT